MNKFKTTQSKTKAILFDLDDTLWPIIPLIEHAERSLHDWMSQHAPQVTQRYSIQDLRQLRTALIPTDARFEYDLWALRQTALSNVFSECHINLNLVDAAIQVFADARNQVQLYDDVLPALQCLSSRVALGTISNGFADLTAIGLNSFFKISLAAHQFGCAKPDPRIFHAACDALHLPPQQLIYVGDNLLLDVQGAQQAGLRGVWINRPNSTPPLEHAHIQPNAVIGDLNELVQFC